MLWAPVDLFLGSTVGFFYFPCGFRAGVTIGGQKNFAEHIAGDM
jgi:hypothetical protein